MKRSLAAAAAAVALLILATAPASASVVEALDLGQLVRRADQVVVGRATGTRSSWDDRHRIVTDVTVRVEQSMKGGAGAGDEIVVRQLGGAIGDLGMRVAGEPTIGTGDRMVLFGRRTRAGRLRPVGMSQGVLPVLVEDGRDVVHPGGAGLALVQRVRGQLVAAPPALIHPRPLEEVVDDIRHVVEEARGH